MSEDHKKGLLKQLLDRLQEDSWQLELLVSGFTIFGLFYAYGPVNDAFGRAVFEGDILKDVYQTAAAAILILIFNLIIHLVLRSLWIGALGLRYISGDVDIEKLKYTERFTNFLNKKIGSFDAYIEKLEKLCSSMFAISFLLIFYVAAMFIVQHLISYSGTLISEDTPILIELLLNITELLLVIGAVLTFFDYVTQGLLKKNKWVASFYFPFYWVFSYLTLSFLYRPLFYKLIDNKFGKRISLLLLPFYVSVLVLVNMYKVDSRLIRLNSVYSSSIVAKNRNYEDLLENDVFIYPLAIQSKVITDPYLKIKIPIFESLEKQIIQHNEGLRQYQKEGNYSSHLNVEIGGTNNSSTIKVNQDSIHEEFLKTFNEVYSIKIDSIEFKPDFIISKEQDRLCLESYIGINHLEEGKHLLIYSRLKNPNTDSMKVIREIPFWYYKE